MFKRFLLVFTLGLAATLLLVSCQRAATNAPLTSLATPTMGTTTPEAQQAAGMGNVQQIATTQMVQTMTALANLINITQTPVPGGSQPTSTIMSSGSTSTPASLTQVPATGVPATPTVRPAQVVVIVATSTPGRPASYTLKSGEFPYCIARRFNVNPDDLVVLNGITQNQVLQPGTVLLIPQTGVFPGNAALHSHPATYTVTNVNETIYSVACYFGNIDPTQIIAANNLVSPYTLHVNQILNIP